MHDLYVASGTLTLFCHLLRYLMFLLGIIRVVLKCRACVRAFAALAVGRSSGCAVC